MKWFFFILFLLAIYSCRKNPQPVDPCASMEPFDISIVIDEFPGDSITVDTDSVIVNTGVTLRAVLPKGYFTKVTWKVGEALEYTEREVPLRFFRPNVVAGETIPIQLIGETAVNSCFPGGKTRDTAYRLLHVINMREAKIIGKYRGLFGNDPTKKDTQTVEVKYYPPDNILVDGSIAVVNIQKGCNSFASNTSNPYWYIIASGGSIGNNYKFFPSATTFFNGCLGPWAYLKLKPNDRDSLIVDYFYSESISRPNPRIQDRFRGKRIK